MEADENGDGDGDGDGDGMGMGMGMAMGALFCGVDGGDAQATLTKLRQHLDYDGAMRRAFLRWDQDRDGHLSERDLKMLISV